MNSCLLFPFFNPIWIKFYVRNVNIILLSICECNCYWHREGDTFLIGKHQITSTCISAYLSLSPLHPHPTPPPLHLPSLLGQGMETAYKCWYSSNDGDPYGQITTTVHFKTSHYFHDFVLRNYHSRNAAGQDLVLWMFDTVNNPLRCTASDVITHCLFGWFFGTRRNKW
jgi:hypothetical protein